jgi:hypothetical protein
LVKGTTAAVYYCAENGKRYVFPNESVYRTWYPDFSSVISVADSFLASLPIGGNVTYRPETRLLKLRTHPTVYQVSKGGVLRPIPDQETAKRLYGSNWNKLIDDLPDAFFANYKVGEAVS